MFTVQNSQQYSGTRNRGILTRRTRKPSTPFAVTRLDFAGPLFTKKDKLIKSYILLLTCATTRALHLELSSDMSVDKFLDTLDRFVSRRGLPHTVYSDNAAIFQAARRELPSYVSS